MYRLLACDIDDTILAPDGSLPGANRDALRRLHEKGVAIVLSSGRATVSVRRVAETILPLADDEFLISFNGARVTSALSLSVLFERSLSPEAIGIVNRYARRHGLVLQGYRETDVIGEQDGAAYAAYARATAMLFTRVDDLVAALPGGTPKLLIIGEPRDLETRRADLSQLSNGLFSVLFSKPTYLEIVPAGVSKGAALRYIADYLSIPISQTIAVGDSPNDSEMLEAAGLGVAVANARDELKRIADVVLENHAAGGAIAELAARFFAGP